MLFKVRDPSGFEHRLILDGGKWYGFENLAHGYPSFERDRVIAAVLKALLTGEQMPHGYMELESL